eukprot:3705489-Pyramimonas_sp.AAC.1
MAVARLAKVDPCDFFVAYHALGPMIERRTWSAAGEGQTEYYYTASVISARGIILTQGSACAEWAPSFVG